MTCDWCGAEVHAGTYLCARCLGTLEIALGNVSTYYADLDTIREKRARYGGQATKGSIGKTQPLPVDGRFVDTTGTGSQLAWDARNTVTTWTRHVLDEWPPLDAIVCNDLLCKRCNPLAAEADFRTHPADTISACCGYLSRFLSRIASHRWAVELLDEMLDLERRLRRMVDRPIDAVYRGVCGSLTETERGDVRCTRELYADPGSPFVRCPDCGCTYDTEERRKVLLDEAEDREVTVRVLARLVTTLGDVDVSEARIENRINVWVSRGRLRSNGRRVVDGRPRPVYRVGDVLDLLRDDAQAKTA